MMKKFKYVILIVMISSLLVGCSNKMDKKPDLMEIKTICELATLETYYHNVATFEKKAGDGLTHLFEKDRKMWIEYTGIVKIGIDMSKVDIEVNGNDVKVTLPKAKVLGIDIDKDKLDKDSYIYSEDSFINKNEITAEEETEAINVAQKEMREQAENNEQLLTTARERAKELILNYINELGDLSGINYNTTWVYE